MGIKSWINATGLVELETKDSESPLDENTGEHEVQKGKKKPAAVSQPSVMANMRQVSSVAPLPYGTTVTSISTPDQSIVTELNSIADGSKRPEYAAYLKAAESLKAIGDVAQRTMTALSVLQGMQNITPQAVVEAVDDRIRLVDAEAQGFEVAYKDSVAKSVTGVETEVESIGQQVQQKQAEIDALQQRRVALKQEAANAQVKLETDRTTFLASHAVVRTSFQNERERIITNLPH